MEKGNFPKVRRDDNILLPPLMKRIDAAVREKIHPQDQPLPSLGAAVTILLRFSRILKPHWARILKGSALSVAGGLFSLAVPIGSKLLFDYAYPARDISLATVVVVGLAVVGLGSAALSALRTVFGQLVGSRMSAELSLMFYARLLELKIDFFDDRRVGEILSRQSDLQQSTAFVTGAIQNSILNVFYLLVVPPLLFLIEWRLALVSLVGLPFTTIIGVLFGRVQRRLAREQSERASDLSGFTHEVVANIRAVKAIGAENEIRDEYRARLLEVGEMIRTSSYVGIAISLSNGAVRAVAGLVYGLLAWRLILSESITLGSFIAFSAFLGYLTGPAGQFAGLFASLQRVAVSIERVFEYLDAPREQIEASHAPAVSLLPSRSGAALSFRNVDFHYPGTGRGISDCSFEVGEGFTAIVGRSGSGKSTLLRLALRFYEPQAGTIQLFGSDVLRLPLQSVRSTIGSTFQENGLIQGSIRRNLTLGLGKVSESEIADALSVVEMSSYVSELPRQLESHIKEAGASLSAGQRQRLLIARTLLRKSPVLILDEPTSSLDKHTEALILKRILGGFTGHSLVLITHQVSTIDAFPCIFVVSNGRVHGGVGFKELSPLHAGTANPFPGIGQP